MGDGHHTKRLSLDTNVLLNLAAGYSFAVDFRKEFQRRHYALLVVPAVLMELNHLSTKGNDTQRERASKALDSLLEWEITPAILTDIEKEYRKNFMAYVEARKILPRNEINDARILADSGIARLPVLVTSDKGLLNTDQVALSLAFEDAGLCAVTPAHPEKLYKALSKGLS